ncbi:hypothetical protein RclHR1_07040014 [Rhizophagus clarus]|uniref:TRP C-terminal domain-containing protein n=1 Tax=Rhizophagus clarus TaxID=94130 RepID=A0A2Z6RWU7_9GLOM|nr:hypothetical protein RclHR1_07040014 [Rhizophagus clarus]GES79628.1 hypothetical protein GLOIN_2v1856710 [Rhizophagus clarus]
MFGSLAEKLFGQSYYARYALIVSLCQAFAVSVLEGFVLAVHTKAVSEISQFESKVKDDPTLLQGFTDIYAQGRSMTIYHVLFIASQFFQLVICVDALYRQNTIQLIALSLFIFAGLSFSAIQVYQSTSLIVDNGITSSIQDLIIQQNDTLPKDAVPYEIVIIVVMLMSSISFAYLAYKLYQEFGWSIYKKIGADMAMRDRYKMYQIFIMLLKFDVFFFLSFSIQFLALVVILEATKEILQHVILSVLTSTGMIIVGFWGVQTERKVLMYLFMLGCCVAEGYFVWKIVDVSVNPEKYHGTRIFVTFFLSVCLALGIVTFTISFLCLKNFDKGLKYHLSRSRSLSSQGGGRDAIIENSRAFSLETVNRHTQRWSID